MGGRPKRKGGPLIEPSSNHNAIGAGIGAFAGEGRLPFLATKIVPARPGGLVARPRLLAMLSGLPAKRLGVIKAPAGFGKTSLAAAWAEQLEQEGCAVAWLTIDSDDDEATRFLFYLSQAVRHACPDVGAEAIELILENNLIDPPAVLSSLINDLAEVFENEQVVARGMRVDLPHPSGGNVKLVRNPINMSSTPPQALTHPPTLGEHTETVLREVLGYDEDRIAALRAQAVI